MCACVTLEQVVSFKCFVFVHLHTHHIRLLCLHLATDRQILPPSAVFHYVQRAAEALIPEQTPCVRGGGQLMKVGSGGWGWGGGSTATEPWYRFIITRYTISA